MLARLGGICASALILASCTPAPESIVPANVSPSIYQYWSCEQIEQEQVRVTASLSLVTAQQNEARTSDAVGVILLGLPVARMSGRNQASLISRYKGEQEALRQASIPKNCAPRRTGGSGTLTLGVTQNGVVQAGNDLRAFRCPRPGTQVTYSDQSTRVHLGEDPENPMICLIGRSDAPVRMLYNAVGLNGASAETVSIRREGMGRLWPVEPGRQVEFAFWNFSYEGRGPYRYIDTWRVLRFEQMTVSGIARNTIVLEQSTNGEGPNFSRTRKTYWLDQESGVLLRQNVELLMGTTSDRSFIALNIAG